MKSRRQKHSEAEARNAVWKALSREQKLLELDARLGKGVGAKRQRSKLGGKG